MWVKLKWANSVLDLSLFLWWITAQYRSSCCFLGYCYYYPTYYLCAIPTYITRSNQPLLALLVLFSQFLKALTWNYAHLCKVNRFSLQGLCNQWNQIPEVVLPSLESWLACERVDRWKSLLNMSHGDHTLLPLIQCSINVWLHTWCTGTGFPL